MAFWVHLSGESIGRRIGTSPERLDFSRQVKGERVRKRKWHSKRECGMPRPVGKQGQGHSGRGFYAFRATETERERIKEF